MQLRKNFFGFENHVRFSGLGRVFESFCGYGDVSLSSSDSTVQRPSMQLQLRLGTSCSVVRWHKCRQTAVALMDTGASQLVCW
jgi:hypothetical protein